MTDSGHFDHIHTTATKPRRVVWSESQPAEYYIASPRPDFDVGLAYAVERYVWKKYRGLFIDSVFTGKDWAVFTAKGPRGQHLMGYTVHLGAYRKDLVAKDLVESAIGWSTPYVIGED